MNNPHENKALSHRTMTQMNIRVTEGMADAFKMFCRETGLTQNEGFAALLLSALHSDAGIAENAILTELQRYKTLNDELSAKVRELTDFKRRVKLTDWKRCWDWANV